MYRSMIEQDIDTLDGLLDEAYTLTHMTGVVQSKQEWLEQVDSGEMRYFSAQERGTSVQVTGDRAILVGKRVVDARIWGSRGTWNLQLTTAYERRSGEWIAMNTVATTF